MGYKVIPPIKSYKHGDDMVMTGGSFVDSIVLPTRIATFDAPGRGGSEQLAIFGSQRARRGAELKALSLVSKAGH